MFTADLSLTGVRSHQLGGFNFSLVDNVGTSNIQIGSNVKGLKTTNSESILSYNGTSHIRISNETTRITSDSVDLRGSEDNVPILKFYDTENGNYFGLSAPDGIENSYVLKLPEEQGLVNQVLKTDGNGNLSWSTPTSSNIGNTNLSLNSARTLNLNGNPLYISNTIGTPAINITPAGNRGLFLGNTLFRLGDIAGQSDSVLLEIKTNIVNASMVASCPYFQLKSLQEDQTQLRISDADNTNYVAIKTATNQPANITFTLPTGIGNSGQVLGNVGGGVMSWVDQSRSRTSYPIQSIGTHTFGIQQHQWINATCIC